MIDLDDLQRQAEAALNEALRQTGPAATQPTQPTQPAAGNVVVVGNGNLAFANIGGSVTFGGQPLPAQKTDT